MHIIFQSMAALMLITVQLSFAEVPKRPPQIDVGSFEYVLSPVDDISRDVIIYWKNIDPVEKSTDDDSFEYRAYYTSMEADNTMDRAYYPSDITFANHAIFVGLDLNIGYNIIVYAANKDGLSTDYASIYIPSLPGKRKDTVSLTLTKVKTYNEGVYELSWEIDGSQKLFAANQLNYYTLYWCENDMVYPNQCNGYMDWIHIPSTEKRYIITVPDNLKNYQFSISANSESLQKGTIFGNSIYEFKSTSSGMVWESCSRMHKTNTSKLKSFWVNRVTQTSMALRWKFDCSPDDNFIYDSTLMYCPMINSLSNYQCIGPVVFQNINRHMTQDHTPFAFVTGLKPATTYRLSIYMTHALDGNVVYSVPISMDTLPED